MKLKVSFIHSVLIGSFFGLVLYFFVIKNAYSSLETSIRDSKPLTFLIDNDPALYSLMIKGSYSRSTFDSIKKYEKQFAWRILLNAGILTPEDDKDDVSILISKPLQKIIRRKTLPELLELTSLELVLDVLSDISGKTSDPKEWRENLLSGMAKCLAGQPKSFENYQLAIDNKEAIESSGILAYWFPRELSNSWGEDGNKSKNLIKLLFTHFEVSDEFANLKNKREGGQENIEEYRQLKEFIQTLIVAIGNDSSVESARDKVVVYHGIMQFFMFISFLIALFFIFQKLLYNAHIIDISDRSKRNLPKFFKWLLNTIPIMGFVGTIIGLMRALADADQIPLAVGNLSTSLAISEVTETLSVAFTTTLMAFVIVIILGAIDLITQYFFINDILDNDE